MSYVTRLNLGPRIKKNDELTNQVEYTSISVIKHPPWDK